jgi:hypothetical protein
MTQTYDRPPTQTPNTEWEHPKIPQSPDVAVLPKESQDQPSPDHNNEKFSILGKLKDIKTSRRGLLGLGAIGATVLGVGGYAAYQAKKEKQKAAELGDTSANEVNQNSTHEATQTAEPYQPPLEKIQTTDTWRSLPPESQQAYQNLLNGSPETIIGSPEQDVKDCLAQVLLEAYTDKAIGRVPEYFPSMPQEAGQVDSDGLPIVSIADLKRVAKLPPSRQASEYTAQDALTASGIRHFVAYNIIVSAKDNGENALKQAKTAAAAILAFDRVPGNNNPNVQSQLDVWESKDDRKRSIIGLINNWVQTGDLSDPSAYSIELDPTNLTRQVKNSLNVHKMGSETYSEDERYSDADGTDEANFAPRGEVAFRVKTSVKKPGSCFFLSTPAVTPSGSSIPRYVLTPLRVG